jgi:hypothetical protein
MGYLEKAKRMKPMTIRTLFCRQRSIHSNDTIANRALIKVCKVSLDIAHKEIQRIHNRSVLPSASPPEIGTDLASNFTGEDPFVPAILGNSHTTVSHNLDFGKGIARGQSDGHLILLAFFDLIPCIDFLGDFIDSDFDVLVIKFGL